ncbi:MAG: hypothetical protein R2706_02540 [Acidimicrobiales bacterium]
MPTGLKFDGNERRQILRRSPITIASLMYGDVFKVFSISDGEMFLPPEVMMMCFIRSTMRTPASIDPLADVTGHEPAVLGERLCGLVGLALIAGKDTLVLDLDLVGIGGDPEAFLHCGVDGARRRFLA